MYTFDIRRKKRVRVDDVVHYVSQEGFRRGESDVQPWQTLCGERVNGLTKYLGDDDGVVPTCIRCVVQMGDR